jgi:PKHD-type hydroxylase
MLFPIAPKPSIGKDTHAYYDSVFTEDEINKILALPEWLSTGSATIGANVDGNYVNTEIRRTEVAWLYPSEKNKWIWEKLATTTADINSRFFHFDLTGFYEPLQLGVYKAENNGYYNWHTDAGVTDRIIPRKLSIVISLSNPEEYEGGELQIKTEDDNPKVLNNPKGRFWFFPSYTLHKVSPVTKGIRQSIVVWVGGPEFK